MTFNDLYCMFDEWDVTTQLVVKLPYQFKAQKLTVYQIILLYGDYRVICFTRKNS